MLRGVHFVQNPYVPREQIWQRRLGWSSLRRCCLGSFAGGFCDSLLLHCRSGRVDCIGVRINHIAGITARELVNLMIIFPLDSLTSVDNAAALVDARWRFGGRDRSSCSKIMYMFVLDLIGHPHQPIHPSLIETGILDEARQTVQVRLYPLLQFRPGSL
jgi:hypothetical protein